MLSVLRICIHGNRRVVLILHTHSGSAGAFHHACFLIKINNQLNKDTNLYEMKHNCLTMNNPPVKRCSHCSSTDYTLKAKSNKDRSGAHFPWDFKGRELPYSLRLFWKDFEVLQTKAEDASNKSLSN